MFQLITLKIKRENRMGMIIVGAGMVSSIGYNILSNSAAIRSSISGVMDIPFSDGQGNFLRGAQVSLPQWWEGYQHLVELISPAISECLLTIPESLHHKIPLLIGLPLLERQPYPEIDNLKLLTDIENKLGLPHHPESQLIPFGQVSGVKALKQAYHLLTQQMEIPYCIVAGVDSYLNQKVISYYLEELRILTEDNSNGFFPGEASGALLIGLENTQMNSALRIIGIGEGEEPAPIKSGRLFKAQGMTTAIREAITSAGILSNQITISLSDLNGEYYKFQEFNISVGRFAKLGEGIREVDLDMWHPIEFIGEIGAAIIPCLLGYAWLLTQKGKLTNQYLLLSASNDIENRVALIIQC